MFNTVRNLPDGTFDLNEVEERIHLDVHDVHYPTTSLICVENTHNKCGGRVLPAEWLEKVSFIVLFHSFRFNFINFRKTVITNHDCRIIH